MTEEVLIDFQDARFYVPSAMAALLSVVSRLSLGGRPITYVAAQVYPKSGLVRIAVSDSGIGIRQSFSENRPPFWDEAMTDLDSVRTALQPRWACLAKVDTN